ncbi:MAG TPA: ATP-binding protein [Chthoniobacterales bacterium]|nr:ATP-binding protein [Chthoniobacterales bacterium]
MNPDWPETNQRSLMAALGMVRGALEQHAGKARASEPAQSEARTKHDVPEQDPAPAPPDNSALGALCAAFGLSRFERDVLLLCAGVELDSSFAACCAAAHGDSRKAYPTFGLALAALAEPHWSALLPTAALRHWRLLEFVTADSLTTSPLRIDERILHHLTGLSYLDERLHGLLEPLHFSGELPPSHAAIVRRIAALWSKRGPVSLIELFGEDDTAKRAIVAAASSAVGIPLRVLQASNIPASLAERETFIRLWERETILHGGALLIDCGTESVAPENSVFVHALVGRMRGAVVVATPESLRHQDRPVIKIEVRRPAVAEQQEAWRNVIEPLAPNLNGQLDSLTSQFSLGLHSIHAAATELEERLDETEEEAGTLLWDVCRDQARRRLDGLAQRIELTAAWDDLVLPEPQRQVLRDIESHVRQRFQVYERWGFATKGRRGLGISALFSGASGTGKTMAGEVLAGRLRLDLYRIDLSSVVSKYIGETEKNLRRIFDAAEQGGAILFFDEADALFGKRSEVKDSHDRYANIEVSYLLQRMESYRGLAILTTNMKSALDPAFLRRIRFVIQFPFPDACQRAEIWRRIFPAETPTEGLDAKKLSRLNVAGGNIRNIALNAAFVAADAREPVRMTHLLRAARSEYAKLEKALTESEIGGWT